MSEEQRPLKRPKGRSPAYPAISLEKAIQRVRQVYARDKQYEIPAASLPEVWGYASLNGPAGLTISALKKFGLINDEGVRDERRISVTDQAVHILDHPSSDARAEAIRDAALRPPIHREFWDEYGSNLPSDANMIWRLTRDRGFTETGAKEFLREWRETLEFAGLDRQPEPAAAVVTSSASFEVGDREPGQEQLDRPFDESNSPSRSEVDEHASAWQASLTERNAAGVQSYPIPIALQGRPPVVISGAFPLSASEWAQFKAVLDAMRPVLVNDDPSVVEP